MAVGIEMGVSCARGGEREGQHVYSLAVTFATEVAVAPAVDDMAVRAVATRAVGAPDPVRVVESFVSEV